MSGFNLGTFSTQTSGASTGGGAGGITSISIADGDIGATMFTITGTSLAGSITFTISFQNEPANTFLAGPTTGIAAQPQFRPFGLFDLPAFAPFTILSNNTGATATPLPIGVSGINSMLGDITNINYVDLDTGSTMFNVGASTTGQATTLTIAFQTQVANSFLAGPTTGGAAQPIFRTINEGDLSLFGYIRNVGTFDSFTMSPQGATVSASSHLIYFQSAGTSFPGMVNFIGQTFGGVKSFMDNTNIAGYTASVATIGHTVSTAWHIINGGLRQTIRAISASYTIGSSAADFIIFADTSGGTFTIKLPAPSNGDMYHLYDSTGNFNSKPLTLAPNSTERINGLTLAKILYTDFGGWMITSNGTNWFLK